MKVNKITVGFVVQTFDGETGKFVSQEFVGGDDVTYENNFGEPVDPGDLPYEGPEPQMPLEMVQPS
jgi:hypothetical protein